MVGAWDQLVNLACRIRKDFHTFTCGQLHLSGGLFLCKGKYPINRAAEQAKYLLEDLAKKNIHNETDLKGNICSRDAFALFNHRLSWNDFIPLRETSESLITAINNRDVPRRSLYKLLHLHYTWKMYRQLNVARAFYIIVRTIRNRGYRRLVLNQHQHLANSSYLPVLVGYTTVKTRHV